MDIVAADLQVGRYVEADLQVGQRGTLMKRMAIIIAALCVTGAMAPQVVARALSGPREDAGQAPQGGRDAQVGPGGGRGGGRGPVVNLPAVATAVTLPTLSAEI